MTRRHSDSPSDRRAPFDVVRIVEGIPEHGVPAGAQATVVQVHEHPSLAYEVEVVDDQGRTLFSGAIDPAQVEPVGPTTDRTHSSAARRANQSRDASRRSRRSSRIE